MADDQSNCAGVTAADAADDTTRQSWLCWHRTFPPLRGFAMLYLSALLIGVVAGLRAMTAPAAVAWGAYLGWLPLAGSWAWLHGLLADAVDLHRARDRRTGHRPVAVDAEPQGAAAVRRPARHRRAVAARRSAPPAGMLGRRPDRRRRSARSIGTLGGAEARGRAGRAPSAAICRPRSIEDAVAIVGALLIVSGGVHDRASSTPSSSAPARPARRWPAG